ncbi:adenylyltransferase/cytidyltransferase family protein [Krasilnikovia sp. M28-CT-15]|uniref:adenylyltransferase/cytidyltransferase family protein n=1 Tax=Krasilnikovia sp. M28-CT-15 TaxID=3373540 RepID=UPI003875CBA8
MDNGPFRLADLTSVVRMWQSVRYRVALCHGCFDLLHYGHLLHLTAARALADRLVVTVTPDRFVNKEHNRPVLAAEQRAHFLSALRVVDWVAVNHWPTGVETIRLVRPDIYVKGIDYRLADETGFRAEREAAAAAGVKVCFTDTPKWSSTDIIAGLVRAVPGNTTR